MSRKKTFLANNSIFLVKPKNEKEGLTDRKSTAAAATATTAGPFRIVFGFPAIAIVVVVVVIVVVAAVVVVADVVAVVESYPLTNNE